MGLDQGAVQPLLVRETRTHPTAARRPTGGATNPKTGEEVVPLHRQRHHRGKNPPWRSGLLPQGWRGVDHPSVPPQALAGQARDDKSPEGIPSRSLHRKEGGPRCHWHRDLELEQLVLRPERSIAPGQRKHQTQRATRSHEPPFFNSFCIFLL